MDPACFLPTHQFLGSALGSDLCKLSPTSASCKAGRPDPPKTIDPTRVITDPVSGRTYSKGRLLGKELRGELSSPVDYEAISCGLFGTLILPKASGPDGCCCDPLKLGDSG
uniref:Uncharacterized protein n=1 Tax=Sphaerodactylus townsendi TaxID=933632 RepID=A0ACB8F4A9_9SAUR